MARYERGDRNPKEDRLLEIANILNVNVNCIKEYNFNNNEDIIYSLLWLEELYPKMNIDFAISEYFQNDRDNLILKFMEEWNYMRDLRKIDSFKDHPFKVENNESLKELRNSIKENGLLTPLVVRKKENGRFEMISGHRRKLALELNGIREADCYIEELNDNEAVIYMVDSNIYRNKILPSEKAFAYKMKLEAIKHQGKKRHFYTTCAEVNIC